MRSRDKPRPAAATALQAEPRGGEAGDDEKKADEKYTEFPAHRPSISPGNAIRRSGGQKSGRNFDQTSPVMYRVEEICNRPFR